MPRPSPPNGQKKKTKGGKKRHPPSYFSKSTKKLLQVVKPGKVIDASRAVARKSTKKAEPAAFHSKSKMLWKGTMMTAEEIVQQSKSLLLGASFEHFTVRPGSHTVALLLYAKAHAADHQLRFLPDDEATVAAYLQPNGRSYLAARTVVGGVFELVVSKTTLMNVKGKGEKTFDWMCKNKRFDGKWYKSLQNPLKRKAVIVNVGGVKKLCRSILSCV